MRRFAGLVVGLIGCASPAFKRASTAPELPPSANAIVVERPPSGAVLIGTADVQMSVSELPSECRTRALELARQAGATHVVMPPDNAGTASKGPRCTAQAYYVPPR
jgi:hypothetical protein